MNEEDRRVEADERDANLEHFPASAPREDVERPTTQGEKEERREALSRQVTASSLSASIRSAESVEREEIRVSRMPTQRDDVTDLERHPTALSRIQTGRSQ